MMNLSASVTELEQKLLRLERYLQADPENLNLLAEVIDLCLDQGKVHAARQYVNAALVLYPNDPFMQCRYGNVLLAQGQLDEAAFVFEKLLSAVSDVSIATNLAFVYLRQERYLDASVTLSDYVDAPDISSGALTLYIRALHHQGDLKQAMVLIQRNLERCRDDGTFLAAASLVCLDDEQLEEAKQLSMAALAAGGSPLEAVVVVGTLALGELDASVAGARFEEAVSINPTDGRSWSGLGLVSLLKQDMGAATEQLTRAVGYMPNHIGTLHALAWCHILSHDISAAQTFFEKAIVLDRNFSESHGGLAVVRALQGKPQLAEESIALALRLDPKCLSARFAQMAISGALKDPVRFQSMVYKLLSNREGLGGVNMADMLTKFMSKSK